MSDEPTDHSYGLWQIHKTSWSPRSDLTLQDINDAKELLEEGELAANPSKWVERVECTPEDYILLRGFFAGSAGNSITPLIAIPVIEREDITHSRVVFQDGNTKEI